MPLTQLLLPSLTVVLTSDHGSATLRDYQRAQSREVQVPIFAPGDGGVMDTIDMRTPTGYIVYECKYAREQDTETLSEDDIKASTWRRLKMFCKIKGLGRK